MSTFAVIDKVSKKVLRHGLDHDTVIPCNSIDFESDFEEMVALLFEDFDFTPDIDVQDWFWDADARTFVETL